MPKLQGYVHGIIMKFLRISAQVALSELQKTAQTQKTIRKSKIVCLNQFMCQLIGIFLSYFGSSGCQMVKLLP